MINLKECRSVKARKIRSGNIITYDLRLDTNEMKLVTKNIIRDIEASGDIISSRADASPIAKSCGITDLRKIQNIVIAKPNTKSNRKYTFVIMKPVDLIQTVEVIIN